MNGGWLTRRARPDRAGLHAAGRLPGGRAYPHNPNGSIADIAGICNPQGNVLGLMPHPEDHLFAWQHPHWSRGVRGQSGLALFENGVKCARGDLQGKERNANCTVDELGE